MCVFLNMKTCAIIMHIIKNLLNIWQNYNFKRILIILWKMSLYLKVINLFKLKQSYIENKFDNYRQSLILNIFDYKYFA